MTPSTSTPGTQTSSTHHHPPNKPIFDEALRRDKIIKNLVAAMPYCLGEWVVPANDEDIARYGNELLVEKVCDTYGKYGLKEKWPESDNPMLITAYSKRDNIRFFCTTNFLKPATK